MITNRYIVIFTIVFCIVTKKHAYSLSVNIVMKHDSTLPHKKGKYVPYEKNRLRRFSKQKTSKMVSKENSLLKNNTRCIFRRLVFLPIDL